MKQFLEDSGVKKYQEQQLTKDIFNGKEPNRCINPEEAVA